MANSFGKKLFGFFILFTVTSVGTTVALIYKEMNKEVPKEEIIEIIEETEEEKPIEKDTVKASELTDLYNQNNVTLEEKLYLNNENLKYIEINGLINKTVENKINQKIKSTVKDLYTEEDEENYNKVEINAYTTANFSNVISITIQKYVEVKGDKLENYGDKNIVNYAVELGEGKTQYRYSFSDINYLNFNLETGEEIKFEDLFTGSTNIREILAKSVYYEYVQYYGSKSDNSTGIHIDMAEVDYSGIENKVSEVIEEYNKNGIRKFGFDNNTVYLYFNNINISLYINLSDNYEHVAIYNRFKTTDSLYEKDDVGFKNCLVFTNRGNGTGSNEHSIFKKVTDNLFVDCILSINGYNGQTEYSKELVKELIKETDSKIKKIKDFTDKNKDKMYIYSLQCSANENKNFELEVKFNNLFEMSKSYYSENAMMEISKYYRVPSIDSMSLVFNTVENGNMKKIDIEAEIEDEENGDTANTTGNTVNN